MLYCKYCGGKIDIINDNFIKTSNTNSAYHLVCWEHLDEMDLDYDDFEEYDEFDEEF